MKFQFTPESIQILKNFSNINKSIVIKPDHFYSRATSDALVGIYRHETPLNFTGAFGIYELNNFLSVIGAFKNPEIEVHDKYVNIMEGNMKTRYGTTPIDLCSYYQKVKGETVDPFDQGNQRYRVEKNFESATIELDFVLPAEKLSMMNKMASLLSAKHIYFETVHLESDSNFIRMTIGGEDLSNSDYTWELAIDSEIQKNCLPKIVRMNVDELCLIQDDFRVQISSQGITKWNSVNVNLSYIIGCSALKK